MRVNSLWLIAAMQLNVFETMTSSIARALIVLRWFMARSSAQNILCDMPPAPPSFSLARLVAFMRSFWRTPDGRTQPPSGGSRRSLTHRLA